jgi:hypothetical protein
MKAWPAATEFRQSGVMIFLIGGLALALSLSDSREVDGLSVVILGGAFVLGGIAHVWWVLRGLRRARPASEPVTIRTPWRTFWQRVLPSCVPLIVVIGVNGTPGLGSSWVLGVACFACGLVLMGEAALAARVERRLGARVLRVEQRFVLSEGGASVA